MEDWFTVERIDSDTFAISEYRHWEEPHSYLLLGSRRAALIDTGLGVANIKACVDRLTGLPVTVLTTHVHWDHIGGHRYFHPVAVHEAEAAWLAGQFPLPLPAVRRALAGRPCGFPEGFSIDGYRVFQGAAETVFRHGAVFDLGNRRLTAIHTPGHSPGHCCFYEAARRTLYSGDLIYRGCLDAFYPSTDPRLFFQSVRKVRALPISRVLPGHHRLDVPPGLISQIERAFQSLDSRGGLRQGLGVLDFGEFQLHL